MNGEISILMEKNWILGREFQIRRRKFQFWGRRFLSWGRKNGFLRFLTNFFRPCIDFLRFGNGILGVSAAKPLCSVVHCVNLQKYFWQKKFNFEWENFNLDGEKWNFGERISSSTRKLQFWGRRFLSWGRKNGFLQWNSDFWQTFFDHGLIFWRLATEF